MKDVGMRIIKLFKSGIGRMKIFESKNVAVKAGLVLLYGLAGVVRAHPRPKGGALRKKCMLLVFTLWVSPSLDSVLHLVFWLSSSNRKSDFVISSMFHYNSIL